VERGRAGVLFDVGYCLMDETPRLEHALGWLAKALRPSGRAPAVADLRDAYLEACRRPDPGEPSLLVQTLGSLGVPSAEVAALRRAVPWDAVPLDPYPEAVAALRALRDAGFRVGVLANQPASTQDELERAGIAALCDGVWLSAVAGLAKPDPAFFRLALEAWAIEPHRIAYVGDRPDNDVAPARALGLVAMRLRRGPHARQLPRSDAERASLEAPDLAEAAARLIAWRASLAASGPGPDREGTGAQE
jgi:HAD superfamily hydrolase (TIGR01509 family)